MNQIFTTVNALRKAVEGSRPNVKFKQIMGYVDQLESQLNGLNLCECPSTETINETETTTEDNLTEEDNNEITDTTVETHSELDFEELEKLSLSELREAFPDIKATSKANFLEQLRAQ
jgi:hypothetical protein